MESRKRRLKIAVDAALAILLIASFMTGHADVHLHAALGLLFLVCIIVYAIISHQKIVQTTKRVASSSMRKVARIDCCLGLAMVVLLVTIFWSGASLMHARMAEGLDFDAVAGTPSFIVHVCGSALFILCALAHAWINRERLEKLLHPEKGAA